MDLIIQPATSDLFNEFLSLFSKYYITGENPLITNTPQNLTVEEENSRKIIYSLLNEGYYYRDHGVMGALLILNFLKLDHFSIINHNYDYNNETLNAAIAIALHNIQKKENIHLQFEPHFISYLLILCDNLQEWERPREESLKSRLSQLKWGLKNLDLKVDYNGNELNFIFDIEFIDNTPEVLEDEENWFLKTFNNLFKYTFRPQEDRSVIGPNFQFKIKGEMKFEAIYNPDSKVYEIIKH
jgi:hypothetical protein